MLTWLDPTDPFPPVERALRRPNGLLAAGADLSPARLIDAYSRGIFPWFGDDDPLLWWSPDPRMVLRLADLRVTRSLRKRIRSGVFRVTADTAFEAVMAGCAGPRADADGTWITGEMFEAYVALHRMGQAHSVESWAGDALVGGLYGVALGRMFFGESMFARQSDASKVAFAHLVRQLERWGFTMIDCQMATAHLASLGAAEMPRATFLDEVRRLVAMPPVPSPWSFEPGLADSF